MGSLRNLGRVSDTGKGPRERRLLLWLVAGSLGAVVVIVAAYHFDVATESNEFCGALCHPNRPEYVAHEVSPHANVECGTCHIGPGLLPKVTAKIYGVGELYRQLTNTYERPIAPPVERLRPANEICEQCHWPEKSYGDQVCLISTFAADEGNSETRTRLVLRISETGEGEGIRLPGTHWHIENPVWYVTRDPERQDIPWVGVLNDDGDLIEYRTKDEAFTSEELKGLRRQMDCLDCHNRATHLFRSPERSLDEALAAGRIDRSLPFIKREALKLLSASYPTQEAGLTGVGGLKEFYRTQYASLYSNNQQAVEQAASVVQDIYRHTTFPEMNLTWDAYANNIGHMDFPGCFRCHDGRHLNAEGEAISPHCNLCHSLPMVAEGGQELSLVQSLSFVFRVGKESTARWVGDMPAVTHPIEKAVDCLLCHGTDGTEPTAASHQGIPSEACTQCHETVSVLEEVPAIPHVLEGRANCLVCHGENKLKPAPDDHTGWTGDACLLCHSRPEAQ